MEVNYRNKKYCKTAKYPIRQPVWLTWIGSVCPEKTAPVN